MAQTLWRPFREQIARWLAEELPPGDELILVGPSAGHCLPLRQLAQFRRLLILDPDPIARWLLQRRLLRFSPRLVCETEPRDLLLAPLLTGAPGLEQVLERRPRAALLFCNVLGQLHFDLSDQQQASFEQAFQRRIVPQLAGRCWASFHDRWSLDFDFTQPLPAVTAFAARPSDEELGQRWFGASGPRVEALEHATTQLFPAELPRRYFAWRIAPRALHVVEALPAR